MKRMRNESGITLVGLVVTIIVLIILAGITMYAAIGDDDKALVSKAKEAGKLAEDDAEADEEYLGNLKDANKDEENKLNTVTMYAVEFYNGSELLTTVKVEKGMTVIYPEDAPIPTKASTSTTDYVFNGKWAVNSTGTSEADLTNISTDRTVYAMFDSIAK